MVWVLLLCWKSGTLSRDSSGRMPDGEEERKRDRNPFSEKGLWKLLQTSDRSIGCGPSCLSFHWMPCVLGDLGGEHLGFNPISASLDHDVTNKITELDAQFCAIGCCATKSKPFLMGTCQQGPLQCFLTQWPNIFLEGPVGWEFTHFWQHWGP